MNNNRRTKEGKLFVYDVDEQRIVREIVPLQNARAAGMIIEVAPGRMLGLTTEKKENSPGGTGLLYGVDITTGEVLLRKALPWPVGNDPYWPHWVDPSYEVLDLVPGPDGMLWTYLKDVLVCIDPKDVSVHVVGKMEQPGWPTFIGNDVYLSGSEQLRRIRNIVKVK